MADKSIGGVLYDLVRSDNPQIQQFALRVSTADEAACKQVVSIFSMVLKGEGELPKVKLCALQVRYI